MIPSRRRTLPYPRCLQAPTTATSTIATSEVATASSCDSSAKITSAGTNRTPAAHAEQPARHPGSEAEHEQADHEVHQKMSTAAEATSRTTKAPATARSEIRCWRAVPASTPAIAGAAMSRPFPRSTLP